MAVQLPVARVARRRRGEAQEQAAVRGLARRVETTLVALEVAPQVGLAELPVALARAGLQRARKRLTR